MKKFLSILFIIIIAIGIISCNEEPSLNMQERLITVSNSQSFSDIASAVSPAIVGVVSSDVNSESVGSGVCVFKDGYILTNSHVLINPNNIKLYLFDGSTANASLIFNDSTSDIAIIKSNRSMPYLNLSKDTLNVGEDVMAVGTPLSLILKHTFTKGIVSALNRTLSVSTLSGESYMHDLIQHDASLNPGNSGGPLINFKGEVVGINTLKITSGEGIGFAIPIKNFSSVLKNFIKNEDYETPYLGVYGYDTEIANYYQLTDKTNGVYVINIDNNSPLYKANVRNGDIITKINNEEINNVLDLRDKLYSLSASDIADIEILRDNEYYLVSIPLTKRPI